MDAAPSSEVRAVGDGGVGETSVVCLDGNEDIGSVVVGQCDRL